MIWLANFHANPISASVAIDGTPMPIASSISLAGHKWYSTFPYTEGYKI
jgi:hypothetical protein